MKPEHGALPRETKAIRDRCEQVLHYRHRYTLVWVQANGRGTSCSSWRNRQPSPDQILASRSPYSGSRKIMNWDEGSQQYQKASPPYTCGKLKDAVIAMVHVCPNGSLGLPGASRTFSPR
ncbi:hypothetical protein BGZ61DRAFT_438360 [Ilyonectria robusta]|uniref:uncharacterized protein n=1 Tax=Ilyonectria robusta TaxID=1079257 RepID=UPI001E8EB4FF|nr:uncharacterized protein BGZ61DRAFT_438360 [Ilyonectria robusta]KAH8737460.1 hypothetical protein BGZ61DRAFT_438360 [Ilyonectria robusta]